MSDDSKILLGVPDINGNQSYTGCNPGQSFTKKKPQTPKQNTKTKLPQRTM